MSKVRFNYTTETWQSGIFEVPIWKGEHVLLTPKDLLTKDDTWINKTDLYEDFDRIPDSIANDQLRQQIHNYFTKLLPKPKKKRRIKKEERLRAIVDTLRQFPELIDYYIKNKEERGSEAEKVSDQRVQSSEQLLRSPGRTARSLFSFEYSILFDRRQCAWMLRIAEQCFSRMRSKTRAATDLLREGQPIERESDLQILYRLTYGTSLM